MLKTLFFSLLLGSLISTSHLTVNVKGQAGARTVGASKVFFGFIPVARYPQDPNEFASIYVVGLEDNTRVKIYSITTLPAKILTEGTVSRGKTLNYSWTQRTAFLSYKVIADKPVHVFQCGGAHYAHDMHTPTTTEPWRISSVGCATYYPGVSGSLVDKEFLIMTAETGPRTLEGPAVYLGAIGLGSNPPNLLGSIGPQDLIKQQPPQPVFPVLEYTIYGVEDANIDIKDASDNLVARIALSKGGLRGVPLDVHKIYHITSTGRIMIASWAGNSLTSVPTTDGEFVGKEFMATVPGWWRGAFIITACDNSEVEVYDIATGKTLITAEGVVCKYTLKANESIYQGDVVVDQEGYPPGYKALGAPGRNVKYIRVVSTGRIQLMVGDLGNYGWIPSSGSENKVGDDVFMTTPIWNGKEYELYLKGPESGTALIFAPQDMEIRVKGQSVNLKANERYTVSVGLNQIVSAKPFVAFSYWQTNTDSWGTYLLSMTDIPVSEPETAEGGLGGWLLYVAVAAVAAVSVIGVLVIKRRK